MMHPCSTPVQCLVLGLIGDGTGGKCIYGKPFFDETNPLTMDAVGVLATVAKGADKNTSQFVLNLASAPKMVDKGHVVFGKLVKQTPADALETIGKVSAVQYCPLSSADIVQYCPLRLIVV